MLFACMPMGRITAHSYIALLNLEKAAGKAFPAACGEVMYESPLFVY